MLNELPDLLIGRKASEVFLEYCAPFLNGFSAEGTKDLEDVKRGLMLPHLVWNAVIMDEIRGKPFTWTENIRNRVKEAGPQGEVFLNFWIKRKKEDFGKYRYTISDFYLRGKNIYDFVMRVETRDPSQQEKFLYN